MPRLLLRDFGTCLSFDGVDDIINAGPLTGFFPALNSGSYACGFWVRSRSVLQNSICGFSNGGTVTAWLLRLNQNSVGGLAPGTIGLFIRDQDNVFKNIAPTSIPGLNNDRWHHCLITGTPSSASATAHIWYIDGLPVATSLQNNNLVDNWANPLTSKFGVGGEYTSGGAATNFLKADIDEFFLTPNLLSAADVLDIYQKSKHNKNPTVLYTLDEAGGVSATDASGNGNTGILIGTPAYSLDVVMKPRMKSRDSGTSLYFDGAGDFVTIPAGSITPFSGESTIGVSFKLISKDATDRPLIDSQWGDNGGGGWQLVTWSGQVVSQWIGDKTDRDRVEILKYVADGKWHRLVVSKSAANSRMRGYLDGELIVTNSSLSFGTTEPDTGIITRFGGNRTGGTEVNCYEDDIQIYNTELTPQQVADDYYKGDVFNGLIHRWGFDEGSGLIALDSVGSAHGVITNAKYSTDVPIKPRILASDRTALPAWPGLGNCVAWWRFKDSDFGTSVLTNEIPGGANLALSAPKWGVNGGLNHLKFDGGANFSATNGGRGFVSVGAGSLLDLSGATSFTVIVLLDSYGVGGNGNGRVLELGDSSSAVSLFSLCFQGAASGVGGSINSHIDTVSGTDGFNNWNGSNLLQSRPAVIAWTYSAVDNTARIISNGVERGNNSTRYSGVIRSLPASAGLYLAIQGNTASQFNGRVYEVAIFKNRQLTPAETLAFIRNRRPPV